MKLLNVNVRNGNLIIAFAATGFLGTEFKTHFAAAISS